MQAKPFLPSGNAQLDFNSLAPETLELSSAAVDSAIALMQTHAPTQKACSWQSYLNALALVGFCQWIRERSASLVIDWQHCILDYSDGYDVYPVVSGLRIGEFDVCLLVVSSLVEPGVCLPGDLLHHPERRSQFYVLVTVQEEWQRVMVQQFATADHLVTRQQSTPVVADSADAYHLPLDWLTSDLDHLLLYLQYLRPAHLPSAAFPSPTVWDQPSLNVGIWSYGQLDAVAQSLKWQLLPPLAPALRSSVQSPFVELQVILQDLQQQCGVVFPPQARSAYQDAQIADSYIRLYALTWPLLSEASVPEWTLLLILGAQPRTRLPLGIKLQVSDQTQVLVERELEGDPSNAYLYARVSGTWQEKFLVAITLNNGAMLTLPPFAFRVG